MSEFYTIHDVAQRTGISAYTLRYYDKEGLLTFVKRSESGIRLFSEADFEPLYTITVLKKSGMPIKEIREFMKLYLRGNETIHERLLMFQEHKKNLQKKIDELNEMMAIVDYKCWYFEEAEKHNDINYYMELKEDEIDPKIKDFMKTVEDFRSGKKAG